MAEQRFSQSRQRLSRLVSGSRKPTQPHHHQQLYKKKQVTNSEARIIELSKSVPQLNTHAEKRNRKKSEIISTPQTATIAEKSAAATSAGGSGSSGPFDFLRQHVLRRSPNVLAIKDSLVNFAWKHQFETEVTSLACLGSIVHECSSLQVFLFGLATLTFSNIIWRLIDQYQRNVVVEDNELETRKKLKKQRVRIISNEEGAAAQAAAKSRSSSVAALLRPSAAQAPSRRTQSTLRESYVAKTGDGDAVVKKDAHVEKKIDASQQIISYKQARRWVDAHLGQFNAALEHFLGLFVAFDVFQAIRSYAMMKVLNSYFFKQEFSSLFVVGNLCLLVLPRLYHYYQPMLTWLVAVFGREFKRAALLVWRLLLGYNNMLLDAQQQQQRQRPGRLGRAVHFHRGANRKRIQA